MFIIHVAPLQKRGVPSLSYFSALSYPIGSVVRVPIRSQEVLALVLASDEAQHLKTTLRTNIYETKKLPQHTPVHIYDMAFVTAAQKTAHAFVTSLGSVLYHYTPLSLQKDIFSNPLTHTKPDATTTINAGYEKNILQVPFAERIVSYKTLVRSTLAHHKSLHICVATTREARTLGDILAIGGVAPYIHIFTSTHTPTQQRALWKKAHEEKHPIVLITTPGFLSIPRNDIGLYIIERESSPAFKRSHYPEVDARVLVEHLARARECPLLVADTVLSTTTHQALASGGVRHTEGYTRTLRAHNTVHIVDARIARVQAKEDKHPFPFVTPDVVDTIRYAHTQGKRVFLFAPRRGIASHTVCNDCGTSVLCRTCQSSLTLHERQGKRRFLCHRCGYAQDTHICCRSCESWNLIPLGIGIERIVAYLQAQLPDVPILSIHKDATSTPKKAQLVADDFYNSKGGVLVGTSMALPYLTQKVSYSAVISLDALLSIPDFRIEEKVFGLIALLREHTSDTLIIETTQPDNEMLVYSERGAIDTYLQQELKLRKQLNYPPFVHLIQISCRGNREKVIDTMRHCIQATQTHKPRVFRGFIPQGRDVQIKALIRIPRTSWPDEDLISLLQSLPFSCTVTVDPDSLI